MSVESLAAVLHHSKAKGTTKLVLLGIANHAGDGGSYPSVATLAKYANVHPRKVQEAIQRLVGYGELTVYVQDGGTQHTPDYERTNRYEVRVTCPAYCDRTANHRDTRRRSGRQTTLPVENRGGGGAEIGRGGATTDRGGVPKSAPGGVPESAPKPSTEPDPHDVTASTTDRASTWPVDNERPPMPAQPPADELAKVRDQLKAASEQHHRREHN